MPVRGFNADDVTNNIIQDAQIPKKKFSSWVCEQIKDAHSFKLNNKVEVKKEEKLKIVIEDVK